MARLGGDVGLLALIGDDPHGELLVETGERVPSPKVQVIITR